MTAPQRILIIRPSALGDVCRTVPVLASLRSAYPGAAIDWLVQDDFAPAIAAHPALDDVIAFPRSRLAHWWRRLQPALDSLRWLSSLRARHYDLVVDCQGLGRSGLMTLATGAPKRVGLRAAREFAWLGYNVRLPKNPTPLPTHTVDQMLVLVEGLGLTVQRDMRLYVAEADRQWWHAQREAMGLDAARYAVLAPGSRWISKRWPIDRFGQLIEPLRQRGFSKVIVIGSPGEVHQIAELFKTIPPLPLPSEGRLPASRFGVIDLVGGTTIGQTMALIAGAGLVVANDSAPLHMAVGFRRACIGLFGPTDPAAVGPYDRPDSVVRGYVPPRDGLTPLNFRDPDLGDSLMRLISTAAVLARIDHVMANAPPAETMTGPITRVPPAPMQERPRTHATNAQRAGEVRA